MPRIQKFSASVRAQVANPHPPQAVPLPPVLRGKDYFWSSPLRGRSGHVNLKSSVTSRPRGEGLVLSLRLACSRNATERERTEFYTRAPQYFTTC